MSLGPDDFMPERIGVLIPGKNIVTTKVKIIGSRGTIYAVTAVCEDGEVLQRYFNLQGGDITVDYEQGTLEHY